MGWLIFMSVYTGNKLDSHDWEELPIEDEVIEQVHKLSEIQDKNYSLTTTLCLSGIQATKYYI